MHEILQISENIFLILATTTKYVRILGRSAFANALFGWSTDRGNLQQFKESCERAKLDDTSIVPKPSHANKINLANVLSGFTERVIQKEPEIVFVSSRAYVLMSKWCANICVESKQGFNPNSTSFVQAWKTG